MEENNKKEVTLGDISNLIQALDKKIESSNAELAAMTQKQFLELEEKIEKVKVDLKLEIASSKEDIKTELNKKVAKVDHNTLKYRVEKLEKKYA